jgi:transcriptional regulator with XRE-family HTH domain
VHFSLSMARAPSVAATFPKTRAKRPQRWPASAALGVDAVKWRVWVGHQIGLWRGKGQRALSEVQKSVAGRAGIGQDALSLIETGQRRIEVGELVALAHALRKGPKDIAALFVPPTAADWAKVVELRRPDVRFRSPPETGGLRKGGAKVRAVAISQRKKAPRGRSKKGGDRAP